MPHRAPIEIRIESDPANLCVVRSTVETAAQRWGLPAHDCDHLVLAVDEALTNIIRHGYEGRAGQPIFVTLTPLQKGPHQGIEVIIDDETDNIDPASIKAKSPSHDTIDDITPGGLGVSIIEKSVDYHQYERRSGATGLRLILHKYASPEPSG